MQLVIDERSTHVDHQASDTMLDTDVLHAWMTLLRLILCHAQVEDDLREGVADLTVANRVMQHVDLFRLDFDALVDQTIQKSDRLEQDLATTVNEILVCLYQLCHICSQVNGILDQSIRSIFSLNTVEFR